MSLVTAAEERVYYNENTIQNLLSRLIEMAAIQPADAAADSSVWAAATVTLADPPKVEFQEGPVLTTTPSTGGAGAGAGGQGEVEWQNSNVRVRMDVCLRDRRRPGMAAFAVEVQGNRVMDVFGEINRMSEA